MPTVMRAAGYRFFFYSDKGDPRDNACSVRPGSDEAKFWLQPNVSIAYNDGFDARTLNRLQKLVELHRDELERAWHEHFA